MYHVLIPVDEVVDRAEAQVAFLTDQPIDADQVRCTVVHAFEDESTEYRPKAVSRALTALEDHGFDVVFQEINSPASSQINAFAVDEDVDQILMSGRKRSPTSKAVFGSVTQSVLLDTEIPVTVVMRDK